MNIITPYPVFYMSRDRGFQKRLDDNRYYNLDAGSSVNEVKAFQDWLDIKHPGWVRGRTLNKNAGAGYGTFGPSTTKAWNKYGSEFMAGLSGIANSLGMPFMSGGSSGNAPAKTAGQGTTNPADTGSTQGTGDHPSAGTDQSVPVQSISKKQKVLFISGGALILLIVIVALAKHKKH